MDFFKSIFKISLGRTPTLRNFPFKNKHYNSHRIVHQSFRVKSYNYTLYVNIKLIGYSHNDKCSL